MSALLPGERPDRMGAREAEYGKAMDEQIPGIEYDVMMFDNRTSSSRHRSEGTLLVRRQPHVVRSPEDTGVVYKLDESGRTDLQLNDPSNAERYEFGSVERESAHRLCLACADAFNYYCRYREAESQGTSKEMVNAVVHHHTVWSLIAFAQIDGCNLCIDLWRSLSIKYPRAVEIRNLDRLRTEICWTQGTESDGKHMLYFVLAHPTANRDAWNPFHFYRMNMWPTKEYSSFFTLENEATDARTLQISSTNDCLGSKVRARAWLSRCMSNADGQHNECKTGTNSDVKLPTRLLDVSAALGTGWLRLVSPTKDATLFEENRSFITLSHSWGEWGAEHSPKLLSSNIEERMASGIDMDEVPKTFQEALRIASWFDVRWLWIDCLCIIQDSEEDWLLEASLMADNYKNAAVNISADAFEDAREGCFVERDPLDVIPLRLRATNLDKAWYVTPTSTYLFGWTQEAPSFSRAWIHRERQLSKRILHFTKGQMMWECCGVDGSGFASETFPGGAPFEETYSRENKFQVTALQDGQANDEEIYATWNDVCENFSRKNLTKPTDMPVVLSSLADDFHAQLPNDEYIGGLWRSTLPVSLLWDSLTPEPATEEYIAPSWSWLSTTAPLELNHRKVPLRWPSSVLVVIEDIELHLKYADHKHGPLSNGRLSMKGYVRRIRLDFGERSFDLSVYDCLGDHQTLRRIGHSWDSYVGDKCKIRLDDFLESEEFDCLCVFVRMKQWSDRRSERDIECLLLQAIEEPGGSIVYKRLGTLDLGDEYALKMRYRIKTGVESTSIDVGEDFDERWESLRRVIQAEQMPKDDQDKDDDEDISGSDTGEDQSTASPNGSQNEEGASEPSVKEKAVSNAEPQQRHAMSNSTSLYQYDGEACLSWLERLTPETIVVI